MRGIVTIGESLWACENALRRELRRCEVRCFHAKPYTSPATWRRVNWLARQLAGVQAVYALCERIRQKELDKATWARYIASPEIEAQCAPAA